MADGNSNSGNAVVTGSFAWSVNFGGGVLTGLGDDDIFLAKLAGGGGSPCDVNGDGLINGDDVQLEANMALGINSCTPYGNGGINQDGLCNAIDVQRVSNAALPGGTCVTGP